MQSLQDSSFQPSPWLKPSSSPASAPSKVVGLVVGLVGLEGLEGLEDLKGLDRLWLPEPLEVSLALSDDDRR